MPAAKLTTADAIKALRSWDPTSVKVICTDGKETEIATPPKVRYKWKRFADALAGFDWARLEALEGKGKVIGVIENVEVEEVPQLELDQPAGAVSQEVAEQVQFLGLMLKAQDAALARQREYTSELLDGNTALLNTCREMIVQLLNIVNSLITTRAKETAAGGDDGLEQTIVKLAGAALSEDGKHEALKATITEVARDLFKGGFPAGDKPTEKPKNGA